MIVRELCKSSSPEEVRQVFDFLCAHERKCVSLLSRFKKKDTRIFYVAGTVIHAVFSFSGGGQILHCIDEGQSDLFPQIFSAVKKHFRSFGLNNLFSIIGEKSATDSFTGIFGELFSVRPSSETEYILMEYQGQSVPLESKAVLERPEIFCCSEDDLERVFPLQKNYELEEVVVDKSSYSDKNARIMLHHALRSGDVFSLSVKSEKKLIAKASINARGNSFLQLGGVYTVNELRNQGIATFFVKKLCEHFTQKGKKIVLFVKKKNAAAISVYKNCGFVPFSEYKIVYY